MVSNITVQSYFSVLLKVWLLGAVFVVNACFST